MDIDRAACAEGEPPEGDAELMTGDEVLRQLVERPRLRKAALTCVLPAVSVAGEWRFRRRDLQQWIAQQTGVATP